MEVFSILKLQVTKLWIRKLMITLVLLQACIINLLHDQMKSANPSSCSKLLNIKAFVLSLILLSTFSGNIFIELLAIFLRFSLGLYSYEIVFINILDKVTLAVSVNIVVFLYLTFIANSKYYLLNDALPMQCSSQ